MSLLTNAYRTCYGDCRDAGGSIAACMESCAGLMAGDVSAPVPGGGTCTDFYSCFTADLPGTITDVTGGVYRYGQQALAAAQRPLLMVGLVAVVVLVAVAVLRP